jgi:hypothetical protein
MNLDEITKKANRIVSPKAKLIADVDYDGYVAEST